MRAHILSIGSELIQGLLTDTNATFLAQELVAIGVQLLHVVQVPDDLPRLERALRDAVAEAELVVCTGGIGPTDDDLTREAIAAVAGETPSVDPALLETIRAFFAGRGLAMPDRNAKQAWLIPAAEALPNPVGTAPGWFVRLDGAIVVAMPGVPREMRRMWREQVLPRLGPSLPARVFRSVNLRTLGIGESAVAQRLDELTRQEQPYVGTYAKDDGVHVRVTASGATAEEATAALDGVLVQVRDRLGPTIYAEDDRSLPAVLIDLVRARNLTLAIAETGTGGRFGSLLFSEPAAAGVVRGMEVRPAPDGRDARALATHAAEAFDAAVGLGMIAEAAPVDLGLFEGRVDVALAGALSTAESFPLKAAFPEIQRRAGLNAADLLRRALREE